MLVSSLPILLLVSFICNSFGRVYLWLIFILSKPTSKPIPSDHNFFFHWIAASALVWFINERFHFRAKKAQNNICFCCCEKIISCSLRNSFKDLLPILKLKFWPLNPQLGRKPPFNKTKNVIFGILAAFLSFLVSKNVCFRGTLKTFWYFQNSVISKKIL